MYVQQFVNQELPNVQAGFKKGRQTRGQIAKIHCIIEKQKNSRKTSTSLAMIFDCGSQQTGKFLKRWEHQTTLPVSWETCMQDKKQQLESDMEQRTGCHPAYLTYMQSTSYEMPGWMTHKLESRMLGEISITSDTQMIPL